MTDAGRDEMNEVIGQFLGYLAGNEPAPFLEGLTAAQRVQIEPVLRILRACWRVAAETVPPIQDDPTARALGLFPKSTPSVSLSGPAVRVARQRKRLRPSEIDAALAGYGVTSGWAFDLEQRDTTTVERPIAEALARVLGVALPDIELTSLARQDRGWAAFARSQRFAAEVQHWAREHRLEVDLEGVRALAGARLVNAVFRRSGEPEEEEWARLLRTLLESWSG